MKQSSWKGFPCGVVATYQEFFNQPQVAAMDMNPIVHHPVIGPMRLAGVPIHFEKTPGRIQRAPPILGQHTEEILQEVGYSAEQITELEKNNVILASRGRKAPEDRNAC